VLLRNGDDGEIDEMFGADLSETTMVPVAVAESPALLAIRNVMVWLPAANG
jgi:hypothetical protein